jgi:hypothetical protein
MEVQLWPPGSPTIRPAMFTSNDAHMFTTNDRQQPGARTATRSRRIRALHRRGHE